MVRRGFKLVRNGWEIDRNGQERNKKEIVIKNGQKIEIFRNFRF